MSIELTHEQIEALYDVCHHDRRFIGVEIGLPASREAYLELAKLGMIVQEHTNVYRMSDIGRDWLKAKQIFALSVVQPNQPAMYLRTGGDLVDDICAGTLDTTIELALKYDNFNDGDELFTVSVKRISLHDLATLPEWEPV